MIFVMRCGGLADVFAGGRDIDIDGPLQLVVIHFRRRLDQHARPRPGSDTSASSDSGARSGMAFKSSMRFHLIFGILHGHEIIVAAFRIHPVARGDHGVRSERRDQVVHHFLRARGPIRWRARDSRSPAAPDSPYPAGCKRPKLRGGPGTGAPDPARCVRRHRRSAPLTCTSIGAGAP